MTETEVKEFLIDLRIKCYDEQQKIMKECGSDKEFIAVGINRIVVCIRKYNREWNLKSEKEPIMKKDGFQIYIKHEMLKDDVFTSCPQLKAALNYL
jgi:hypothetical protein